MDTKPIETVCVVGAGFMGAQIGLQDHRLRVGQEDATAPELLDQ